jgi:hypothetical protein
MAKEKMLFQMKKKSSLKNSFGMPNPAELTLNQSRATSGGGEYGEVVEELAQLEESEGIKTR